MGRRQKGNNNYETGKQISHKSLLFSNITRDILHLIKHVNISITTHDFDIYISQDSFSFQAVYLFLINRNILICNEMSIPKKDYNIALSSGMTNHGLGYLSILL